MSDNESGFSWGVLAGIAAVVVVGAAVLSMYYKTSAGALRKERPRARSQATPKKGKAGRGRSGPAKKR